MVVLSLHSLECSGLIHLQDLEDPKPMPHKFSSVTLILLDFHNKAVEPISKKFI